jgi:hypothetical protein
MSYDICLKHPITGEELELDVPHQMKGGTYQLGGCRTASLNITYNYAGHYYRIFGEKGIRALYGTTAAESVHVLDDAIAALGDEMADDYWKATEGNAKAALIQLRALAMLRPDGVWDGD